MLKSWPREASSGFPSISSRLLFPWKICCEMTVSSCHNCFSGGESKIRLSSTAVFGVTASELWLPQIWQLELCQFFALLLGTRESKTYTAGFASVSAKIGCIIDLPLYMHIFMHSEFLLICTSSRSCLDFMHVENHEFLRSSESKHTCYTTITVHE